MMGEKIYSQTKGNMQHHMNVLQSKLAKMENHEARAEKAEKAQRDMAIEIKRLRAALAAQQGEAAACEMWAAWSPYCKHAGGILRVSHSKHEMRGLVGLTEEKESHWKVRPVRVTFSDDEQAGDRRDG